MINTVRLAMPAEAVDVARIQRRAWQEDPVMRTMLQRVTAQDATQIWHRAIVKPQLATMRVLVALNQGRLIGFTATRPSPDPDATSTTGQITELTVDPDARRAGHGTRLLQAAVDTMRTDGFQVATIWLPAAADEQRAFIVSTGWAADGAHLELGTDDGQTSIKLVRLHTTIA